MNFRGSNSASARGTVILVALCFVAVMGIVLGSYLAVCSRAMQLSNRSFQTELSRQLAEAGLEEALRAFNKNDWSDWTSAGMTVDWTLDATNKRARATISYPADKFGQGARATVKVRVDNYDSAHLGLSWSVSKNYQINDLVGDNGIWYRSLANHSSSASNRPPNLNFWAPEGVPWAWVNGQAYALEDMVNVAGAWYRCKLGHTAGSGNMPPNATNWARINAIYTTVPSPYPTEGLLQTNLGNSNGTDDWAQLTAPWNWNWAAPVSWRWRDGVPYNFGDAVNYENIWYRCIQAHSSNWSREPIDGTTFWLRVETIWAWSSSIDYNQGDVVYHNGTGRWYRCIQAHSSQTPSITSAYWADTPLFSNTWSATQQYSTSDVVTHNGVWYLSLQNSNMAQNPATDLDNSHWISGNTTNAAYQWNATTPHAAGAYRCYGGVWYRCLVTNTGVSPNNTTYWTATWTQSSGVTTGAPVVHAEATVTLGDRTTSRTQLRALIAPAPLFPNAVAATNLLTISAAGGTVDSYDSNIGTYGGANVGFSAMLAAGGTGTPTLSINNTTTVKGYVAAPPATTSPFAPRVSFGGSTTVKGASSPVVPSVDLSRVNRNPYIPDFDIQHVAKGRLLSTFSGVILGTPGATTPSVYYYTGNMDMNTSAENITINGPVILYVSGNLRTRTNANARVVINPTGSLRLHIARDFQIDATGGGIVNNTGDPKKLSVLLSRSGTDTFNYSEAHDFYGTIYLPQSSSTFTIPGNAIIYGAVSAQNITFSGAANVHYDTSLRYAIFQGVDQPYTVTEWRELPASEAATMP